MASRLTRSDSSEDPLRVADFEALSVAALRHSARPAVDPDAIASSFEDVLVDTLDAVRGPAVTERQERAEHRREVCGVDVSVIIPAFNAAGTIRGQLDALAAQRWHGEWEVVVADNGSADETRLIVEEFTAREPERFRLVDAGASPGAAFARNRGVENSSGEWILFCDADDVVGEQWLPTMAEAVREHDFVTGPQEEQRLNPEWLRGVYGSVITRERQLWSGVFPFGPTANLGVRRTLFESVGGFDERVRVFEDLDLCLRLWLVGAELQFVPGGLVHYRYRDRLMDLWRQAVAYGRAAPAIRRDLVRAGRAHPSHWSGARNWIWLVRKLPSLRTPSSRARWIVVAGGCLGRLSGSWRVRSLML